MNRAQRRAAQKAARKKKSSTSLSKSKIETISPKRGLFLNEPRFLIEWSIFDDDIGVDVAVNFCEYSYLEVVEQLVSIQNYSNKESLEITTPTGKVPVGVITSLTEELLQMAQVGLSFDKNLAFAVFAGNSAYRVRKIGVDLCYYGGELLMGWVRDQMPSLYRNQLAVVWHGIGDGEYMVFFDEDLEEDEPWGDRPLLTDRDIP